MRILFWTNFYLPFIGGLETIAHELVLELRRQNHEVMVVCNSTGKTFVNDQYDGVNVARFPLTYLLHQRNVAEISKAFHDIKEVINKFNPEVINLHGLSAIPSIFQCSILSSLPNFPTLLTVHGLLGEGNHVNRSCNRLLQLVTAINFVSKELAREMPSELQGKIAQNPVIYNGMSYPEMTHTDICVHPLRLMTVSRLSSEKGVDVAIDAIKILIDKEIDTHLTIAGDGIEEENLVNKVKAMHLEKNITFIGAVEHSEILHRIQQCSILLIPSRYEPFGMVALEAACMQRPVIASRTGGLPEVVVDKVTGLLVTPEDPQALADAIQYFYDNPEQLEMMGKAGEQRVRQEFSIQKTANRYIEVYKGLIGASNANERESAAN